jgi:hypothetical protein
MNPLLPNGLEKPSRAARLLAKAVTRKERREFLRKKSAGKQKRGYGGSNWPAAKAACLKRDGGRCIFRCLTQHIGVTVHHWQRTVGAGGKNDLTNLVVLCAIHHDHAHIGGLSKDEIRDRLVSLHGPSVLVPEQVTAPQAEGETAA